MLSDHHRSSLRESVSRVYEAALQELPTDARHAQLHLPGHYH